MGINSIDFTLTDIPYDVVNRDSNGLRNLNKGKADELTFDLCNFLEEVYRVTKNSICIFCSKEQFSIIYDFLSQKTKQDKGGTVRPIVWEKTNPSPMNGQFIYLSGVELAVWFKKKGAKVFNAHCKNSVFHFPNGSSKLHPTEKNSKLIAELITDNTNINDVVFDPCLGGGTHCKVAKDLGRQYIGFEIDSDYFKLAQERIDNFKAQTNIFDLLGEK